LGHPVVCGHAGHTGGTTCDFNIYILLNGSPPGEEGGLSDGLNPVG